MKSSRKWQWEQDTFVNGCNTVELSSWRALYEFINRHSYAFPRYIFRGHSRQSYELNPNLSRIERDKNDQNKYLEQFKRALQGRLPAGYRDNLSERDLWILGHSAGLQTPLLAWTQAVYIAAFFAFYPERNLHLSAEATIKDFRAARTALNESRTIYVLNRELVEERRKKFRLDFVRNTYPKLYEKLKQLAGNLVALNDPYYLDQYLDHLLLNGANVYYNTKLISACETATRNRDYFMADIIQPNHIDNPLLVSQACLFTLCPTDISLEDWVKENFADSEQNVLIKINIPNTEREECLNMLNLMNISQLTLFPNIQGSAQFCNDLLRGLY